MTKIIKTGHYLKSLPAGCEATDGSFWGVATKQIVDSDGDVVEVKGIDYSDYHSPPRIHAKMLANHAMTLASGEPSVVGRIEEFKTVSMDGTDALIFRGSWAKDGAGQITPLAKKYADLYEGGYLDSFSIGFIPVKAKGMKNGTHFEKSKIYEVSPVSIPANPESNMIVRRALGMDVPDPMIATTDFVSKSISDAKDAIAKNVSEEISRLLAGFIKDLDTRLDQFESAYVSGSLGGNPSQNPEVAIPKSLDIDAIVKAMRELTVK